MVAIVRSIVKAEPSPEPLLSRRIWARSQDDAHDRARIVTKQMEAERWVLVARSWVRSARGGTVTLVFTQKELTRDPDPAPRD